MLGSASVEELGRRLEAAVDELASGRSTGSRWRGLLNDLLGQVWFLNGRMDARAASRGLEALRAARQRARGIVPPEEAPPIRAARSLEEAQTMLLVAAAAAKPTELLRDLRGRSPTVAAVVDILGRAGRFMKRGEIRLGLRQRDMPVTGPRVSQILNKLHDDGFLVRQYGSGRGAHEVAFYALSDEGRAAWLESSAPEIAQTPKEAELAEKLRASEAENDRLKKELKGRREQAEISRKVTRVPMYPPSDSLVEEILARSGYESGFDPPRNTGIAMAMLEKADAGWSS